MNSHTWATLIQSRVQDYANFRSPTGYTHTPEAEFFGRFICYETFVSLLWDIVKTNGTIEAKDWKELLSSFDVDELNLIIQAALSDKGIALPEASIQQGVQGAHTYILNYIDKA